MIFVQYIESFTNDTDLDEEWFVGYQCNRHNPIFYTIIKYPDSYQAWPIYNKYSIGKEYPSIIEAIKFTVGVYNDTSKIYA